MIRILFFLSFSFNRCYFHLANTYDDRSTLSDDDEGISSDDLDDEDISRKAIHRALKVKFFFSFTFEGFVNIPQR